MRFCEAKGFSRGSEGTASGCEADNKAEKYDIKNIDKIMGE